AKAVSASGDPSPSSRLRMTGAASATICYPPRRLSNVYTFKDFEGSSHRILIDLIGRFAPRGGTLLDLGAAGGELGAAVRDQFDRTVGFEFDADRIGQLRGRFDSVVI